MKILFTHERFAPDFAGGGEYVVLEMARHLMSRGHSVHVLTVGDPSITSYEGIPTTRLKMHRYRFNFAYRAIEEHARDVDIIQTFNYNACYASLVAGRRLKKPVICSFLGLFGNAWREMKGPIVGRAFQWWEQRLVRLPFDRMLFISDFSRELGLRLGASPERSVVNEVGIDLDRYAPHVPKDDVVLFVGKIDVRKGIDTILDVASRIPNLSFRIFGWGNRSHYRDRAPANVQFIEFERGAKLREEFARAKFFLFPSKAETFGIALVEAMASGCVVISTIPLDFEGVHVPDGHPELIAAEIRRLLENEGELVRIGQTNIDRSKKYNWDRHIQKLEILYQELLDPLSKSSTNSRGAANHA